MNHKLETKRLILIPTSKADGAFIFELMNSPKWIAYIGDRNIKTIADAEQYIAEKITPQHQDLGYGNYTVIIKSTNTKIGSCGLYNRAGLEGVDLGFAFLPEFEKQGFAFEASNLLIHFATEELKLNPIKAITREDNASSQQLLTKLGFKYKETISLPPNNEELLLYIKNYES